MQNQYVIGENFCLKRLQKYIILKDISDIQNVRKESCEYEI